MSRRAALSFSWPTTATGLLASRARTVTTPLRASWLAALIVLSVTGIASLGVWDETRESQAALEDFAMDQTALARVAAAGLAARVDGAAALVPSDGLVPGAPRIESDHAVVLVLFPGATTFERTDGGVTRSEPLRRALETGRTWTRLTRFESAALGLPERTAIAGLSRATTTRGRYGVAVVTSALRERDRESRARMRLVLGVVLAASLVSAFGGIAVRARRKELELAQALALENLAHLRDEQLSKAGRAAAMLTLAAGVAHEISTPLGAIALRAEQLEPHVNDARSARALAIIHEQTARIKEVVKGFLHLARGGEPVREHISPGDVVRTAGDLVAHRFAAARVELGVPEPDSAPLVIGDARLLEQAVVNLLLNACDACSAGGHVRARVVVRDDHVEIEVADDGTGIDRAHAARVIEPFFTTKSADKGTGLGLAIAAEIAKMHRGALSLEPRRPRGAVATLRLPREEGDHATDQS